jgi:dihydropteroate synthase
MDAGAEIINDITGLSGDPAMLPLAAEVGCGVCAMHMRGTPRTMQEAPVYNDVVAEVTEYLQGRRDALLAAGVELDRIALDPGIGFSKTTAHNLQLLSNAWRLHALGCPVLIGHSRKRFLAGLVAEDPSFASRDPLKASGAVQNSTAENAANANTVGANSTGGNAIDSASREREQAALDAIVPIRRLPPIDRTAGTIAVALSMARQGVQILRVHDVGAVRQALLTFAATGGLNA